MPDRRVRVAIALGGTGLLVLSLINGGESAGAAAAGRVPVAGSSPSWAVARHRTGTVSPLAKVSVRVGLQFRGGLAHVQQFDRSVSDPSSPQYGQYLTPSAFRARFAPTRSTVRQVERTLSASGVRVTSVARGRLWINATGTASAMDDAFGVTLHSYRVHGHVLRAPSGPATVPASIATRVSWIDGLSTDTAHAVPNTERPVDPSTTPAADEPPASQCSSYWGQYQQTLPPLSKNSTKTSYNTYLCGYSPTQLRTAYHVQSMVKSGNTTGKGVTVAIVDAYASPTMLADANEYADAEGEPEFQTGQYTETADPAAFDDQNDCNGEAGWNGEETLDVEAVHTMAPGANIHYYGANDCYSLSDSVNDIVQSHGADIVSNSYGYSGEGEDPGLISGEDAIFSQAVAEGIGLYFSSGDDGDNVIDGDGPQPNFEATDPNVTAVGGTTLMLNQKNARVMETGWEDAVDYVDYSGATAVYEQKQPGAFVFGAGGGTSSVFAQPSYQQNAVPAALAGPTPMRTVPDVAADADPFTGMLIGQTVNGSFGLSSIGGTSEAAPLFAGIQALASQHRRTPIGFANPLLYSLPAAALTDITAHHYRFSSLHGGYLATTDVGDTQTTTPGYDDVTGLGVPNGTNLVKDEKTATG